MFFFINKELYIAFPSSNFYTFALTQQFDATT